MTASFNGDAYICTFVNGNGVVSATLTIPVRKMQAAKPANAGIYEEDDNYTQEPQKTEVPVNTEEGNYDVSEDSGERPVPEAVEEEPAETVDEAEESLDASEED